MFNIINPIKELEGVEAIRFVGIDSFGDLDEAPYKFRYIHKDGVDFEIIYLTLEDIYSIIGEVQFQLFERMI
jgi:hypothetical protein